MEFYAGGINPVLRSRATRAMPDRERVSESVPVRSHRTGRGINISGRERVNIREGREEERVPHMALL